ncbi:SMC-Scp complex subunit ScpB [Pelovirga terrestris]|uniref:Segregation and condensation protein B n=1 Tax=Pelovirga terrestris TaxID=2771352 RepID=A0A8J6UQL3_9BACT|nr:SMC-Scp complex subunit ScpB [Pelovirga terrestris]MBD1399181.1 SMC-Scp complex subunit ScpB [Pelovirga terrestris]
MTELRAVIEAFLFVAGFPLTLDKLADLAEADKLDIKEVIAGLSEEYCRCHRGIRLVEVAGGYQFRSDPALAPWLRRLQKERVQRLSAAALETLAIIAYRQPVTRAEIEYLRGVDSGGVLKTLLERNLLRILGKKEVPGRPLLYGTSRYFLELFGLKDLNDLPTLKEFAALDPELVEALPLESS